MKNPRRWQLVGALVLLTGTATFAALKWLPRPQFRALVPRNKASRALETQFDRTFEPTVKRVAMTDPTIRKIVAAAHAQEGDEYDAEYRQIAYPGGDVPRGMGACTDVVVRSLRAANIDLQTLIHRDMKRDFRRYGDKWRLGRTDKNIDHRRVPNQITYFKKHAQVLPMETSGAALKTWKPADIVMWRLPDNKWHTGVVSDGIGTSGKPLVIHNAYQCAEQDYLDNWPIIGHFRVKKSETRQPNRGAISSSGTRREISGARPLWPLPLSPQPANPLCNTPVISRPKWAPTTPEAATSSSPAIPTSHNSPPACA